MSKVLIYNKDCLEGMKELMDNSINIVLTSPPYNTGRTSGSLKNHEVRYDVYMENRDNTEYSDWTVELFRQFDRLLKPNGCILYNVSYGNENPEQLWLTIADIINKTNLTIADTIIWRKGTALPNNVSSNKLTRICEFVFVFCRKSEYDTFGMNKKVMSYSRTGQKYYESIFNYIEARNNDQSCDLNKATFSTEFVEQLLKLYSTSEVDTVLDPFMGTGTTAVGCLNLNRNCIGFEISSEQCSYAQERVNTIMRGRSSSLL